MTTHALVLDGAVLAYREDEPNVDQSLLAPGKPRWLPLVDLDPPVIDPRRDLLAGPVETIEAERVVRSHPVQPRDPAARRAEMKAAVDRLTDVKMAAGYPHDFGGVHGVKVLQTRDIDRPNWLALATSAQVLIGMGQGEAPMRAIRTADNVNVPVTANAALAAMMGMQAYLGGFLDRCWALKDAIASAPDHDALDAIDITAGWPSSPAVE